MRASWAENNIPRFWCRCSSETINVLLLLALSITIAMICKHTGINRRIVEAETENLPSRQGHIVPVLPKQPRPYSLLSAPQ